MNSHSNSASASCSFFHPGLHLIVDNYSTHKSPTVQRWLKRHKRFHVHFILHFQAKLLSKPRRNHAECLKNPANKEELLGALGHRLRYPQLGVLMGRMPKMTDIEELELAQSREPLVRIRTYDEIMEFQRNLIE